MDLTCLDRELPIATIIQGEDKTLNVRLYNPDGTPYDVTQATEIVCIFAATNPAGYIEKKLSLSGVTIQSGPGGWILPHLVPADTALLTVGAQQSFEVWVTIAGLVTKVQFLNSLNVVASLFPLAT